jgi:type IV secretory pathway TrbL component
MDDFFYMLLLAVAIPLIFAALVVALSQFSAVRRLDERLHPVRACTGLLPGAAPTAAPTADTCAHARIDAANRSGARTGNRSRRGSRERTGIARCSAAAAAIASPIGTARQRLVAPAGAAIDRL